MEEEPNNSEGSNTASDISKQLLTFEQIKNNTWQEKSFRSTRRHRVHVNRPGLRQCEICPTYNRRDGQGGENLRRPESWPGVGTKRGHRATRTPRETSWRSSDFRGSLRQLARKRLKRLFLTSRVWDSWDVKVAKSWQGKQPEGGPGHGHRLGTAGRKKESREPNVGPAVVTSCPPSKDPPADSLRAGPTSGAIWGCPTPGEARCHKLSPSQQFLSP